MPAKKKQQRNGFYWFMQDIMPELRAQGYTFQGGIAEVVPVAMPRWKNLTADKRERYEKKAKDEKKKAQRGVGDDRTRLDNQGNVIANRVNEVEELIKRKAKERRIARSRWPPRGEEGIMDEKFYFISFEYLCETEEGDFMPREVGMVEWSMNHGITKTFHKFIDPGGVPLGYRYTCQSHSELTHQIPIERFELADQNHRGIWIQMENFVNPSGEKKEYPPIYCVGNEMRVVECCMDWLHQHAAMGYANRLQKLYHLECAIIDLYEWGMVPAIGEGQAIDLLHTSAFDYEPNTRCAWHEEQQVKFCAVGTVKRYAFALSDSLSAIFNFDLTSAHLPVRTDDTPTCTVIPPSSVNMGGRPYLNQYKAPAPLGRGTSVDCDAGPYAARDFRYNAKKSYDGANYADDDEDDEVLSQATSASASASQPLRRPNAPSLASQNMAGYTAPTAPWAAAAPAPWSAVPPAGNTTPSFDSGDFPALGAPAPSKPKYAGRANAPPPHQLPKPTDWQAPPAAPSQRLPQSQPMAAAPGGSTTAPATSLHEVFARRSQAAMEGKESPWSKSRPVIGGSDVDNVGESSQRQQPSIPAQQFQPAPAPQTNAWAMRTPTDTAPQASPAMPTAWGRGAQRAPAVETQPGLPAQPAYGRGRGVWGGPPSQPGGLQPAPVVPPTQGVGRGAPGYGRGLSVELSGMSLDNNYH